MQLNDLLHQANIDPTTVLVFRHRPKEPQLRKVLSWLANERHDVFNAYQQTQGPIVEKAMKRRATHIAAFIGHEPGKALFVGLYKVGKTTPLSFEQYWKVPANVELKKFGSQGMTDKAGTTLWFDLVPVAFRTEWKGKLIVNWPGKELSWWRWADQNEFPIHAIVVDSILDREMPKWTELVLSWDELGVLPKKWCAALEQWRGIYFILDISDGKGYVGAAYGQENLLGRWREYAASGHGGNKQLLARNRANFRFSILQIVSHDMDPADVQSLEKSWKNRLHSREFGLNDN
jgi:GIY-YIG catalytic domain